MIREKDIAPGKRSHLPAAPDGRACCVSSTGSPSWKCTREAGHKGKHAAHGINDVQYATWDNTDCKIVIAGKRRTRR